MDKLYCHLCGKEITGINTIKSDIQDNEFWEACDDINCESGGTWFTLSFLKSEKEIIMEDSVNKMEVIGKEYTNVSGYIINEYGFVMPVDQLSIYNEYRNESVFVSSDDIKVELNDDFTISFYDLNLSLPLQQKFIIYPDSTSADLATAGFKYEFYDEYSLPVISKTVALSKLVDIDKIKAKCALYTIDNEIDVKIEYIVKQQNASRRLNFIVDVENSIYNDNYKMMFYNILNENEILNTESKLFNDCHIKSFGFGEEIVTYLIKLLR